MELGLGATLLLSLVSLIAGMIDAIAGGGGLLTLPALLHAGLPPHLALATSKGQSVFGSGAAMIRFARAGHLRWRRCAASFAAGFSGSLVGATLVTLIDPSALKPLLIVLLLAAAVLVMIPRPTNSKRPERVIGTAMGIAVAVGFYDGFFGPGCGTLLIIGFVWLLGDDPVAASGNAKVVNFASNLAALALFASKGLVLWHIALPMALGQFIGGSIGAQFVITRGAAVVRRAAATVALAMVCKLGWGLLGG